MIRLYRWLLRLLPGDLRERFGGEMEEDLRRRMSEAGGRSLGPAAEGGRAVRDLVLSAAALRLASWRDARPRLGTWSSVVRQAVRSLARRRGLTGVSVATLALASSLGFVAFSVLDGVLHRPLPYPEGDRLAMVNGASSAEEVAGWSTDVPGIEAAAAFTLDRAVATTPAGAVDARILAIGPGFPALAGIPLEEGRTLASDELRTGGTPAVLVSRTLWRQIHGETPLAAQTIELDGSPWPVVGIVPDGFAVSRYEMDIYRGVGYTPDHGRFSALARLEPGASIETVRDPLARATAGEILSFHLLEDTLRDGLRGPLRVLLLAAGLVVVIASANVASLAIARDLGRRPEVALRRALGAGRGRIAAGIVVEGLVLASAGIGLGLLLAPLLRRAVLARAPGFLPTALDLGIGVNSLVAGVLGVLAVTVAIGVVPAWLASGRGEGHLRAGMVRDQRRAGRWMAGLVAVEAAFATALVIGSVLLVETFLALNPTTPGFTVRDRLTAELRAPTHLLADDEAVHRWSGELLAAAQGLEGRPAAALVSYLPLSGLSAYLPARLPEADAEVRPTMVHHRAVSAGYRSLMEIPLLRGRDLAATDAPGAPRALVLNERAARTLWPDGEDPLGRTVHLEVAQASGDYTYTVVGVVADARGLRLRTGSQPEVWTSIRQTPSRHLHVLVAPGSGPLPTGDALRSALIAVDRRTPILAIETLGSVVRRSMVVPRFQLTLLGILTLAGITLAGIGSFAVLGHRVRTVRTELGIRLALGASPVGVAGRLVRQTLVLALVGAAVGGAVTWAGASWVGSRLFLVGVEPRDPGPYAVALAVVAALALVGAAVPAWRAARLDPRATLAEVGGGR